MLSNASQCLPSVTLCHFGLPASPLRCAKSFCSSDSLCLALEKQLSQATSRQSWPNHVLVQQLPASPQISKHNEKNLKAREDRNAYSYTLKYSLFSLFIPFDFPGLQALQVFQDEALGPFCLLLLRLAVKIPSSHHRPYHRPCI